MSLYVERSFIENSKYLHKLIDEVSSKSIDSIDSNLLYEVAYADTYLGTLLSSADTVLTKELKEIKGVLSGISISDIAEKFKRIELAIQDRLRLLGYYPNRWNDYEVEILRSNSRYLTVDGLIKLLPFKRRESIIYKCQSLKIPYHLSKKMCEERD